MSDPTLLGASQLAAAIRARQFSSEQAVEAYLNRIAKYNSKLNAIVTLDTEGARKRANAADAALLAGETWGPLHGVPVTIKDVFASAGIRTTSGFKPLAEYVPTDDATVVARLRAAGAIILGKTNTPQFATDAQTNNRVFGRTNNPWDPSRTPGGSSGGSAAAMAARMSALEIGSDIGGSLRTPAHFCGVYALKPTDWLVPWTGHISSPPGWPRGLLRYLVSVGPIARSVEDLRLALQLIAGPDQKQWEIPPVSLEAPPPCPLCDLRFAWSDDFGGVPITTETRNALSKLAGELEARGCKVERRNPLDFDFQTATMTRQQIQMTAVFARATPFHIPRLAFRSLAGVAFKSNPVSRGYLLGMGSTLATYGAALARRDALIAALDKFLSGWDAWLCPVAPSPAFPHIETLGTMQQMRATVDVDGRKLPYTLANSAYTDPFNTTGNPVVVLPIARSKEGLPIGIQVVGRRWKDMTLLDIAEALTQITGCFVEPPGYE